MRRAPRARTIAVALAALTLSRVAGAEGPPVPAPVDPSSRLPAGGSASEYWDLVARLGQGVLVTVRFSITNEGPGERSAAAFGHVLRPGSVPIVFQNGRRQGAWELSPDGRRIEIGSSLLDLQGQARHFEVDNDKRGVKVFLDWRADASAQVLPETALPAGYAINLLQLATPVRASIQVAGMTAPQLLEGTVSLTHTWMASAENERVLRRIDVMSTDPGSGMYLVDITGPAGSFSWLSAEGPGAPAQVDSRWRSSFESASLVSSYRIPSELELDTSKVQGRVKFGPALLDVDPLALLPTFLRVVYSLRGRPHRSWAEAAFQLTWVPGPEHSPVRIAGDAIASLSFLDVLPPTDPTDTHP